MFGDEVRIKAKYKVLTDGSWKTPSIDTSSDSAAGW
jgi:hypothetical protein